MNAQTPDTRSTNDRLAGGVILILIGLASLLGTIFPFTDMVGQFILPGLGLIFLLWGFLSRKSGLFVPGGILSGLGWGIWLANGPLHLVTPEYNTAPVILISLALGFAVITPLTALVSREVHWWALIPAAILGFIGTALLMGSFGLEMLTLFGKLWPVALVLAGLALILRRDRRSAA